MYSKWKEKIINPQSIANLFADYYRDLYNINDDASTQPVSTAKIDAFLSRVSLHKLTESQLDYLNKPVTLLEMKNTIQSSCCLSPWALPNKYYRTFTEIISPHLLLACQFIIDKKKKLLICYRQS